jgi:exopolysaccharide biosynthesis polyprenyl glycosylphosphotransferase
MLADLAIMLMAFGLAIGVSYSQIGRALSFSQFIHMRVEVHNFVIFLGLAAIWHSSFKHFGLYRSRRLSARWTDAVHVARATSVGTTFLLVFSILFRIEIATPAFLAVFWLTSTGLTVASRLAIRSVLEAVRRSGRNIRHLVIVGTNPRAFDFARRIGAKPELGYRLVGFADELREIPQDISANGHRLVAHLDEFHRYLREHVVDEVIVCLPVKSLYAKASHIITVCEEQGVLVRFLSDIFDPGVGRAHTDRVDDDTLITFATGAMQGVPTFIKRALDVSVSLVLLIILAPLAAAIMLMIAFASPGPVYFVQERLGLNKRRFRLFKFRTMVADAEARQAELEHMNEVTGPVFKITNDPRITSVGKFLRKTSLDELPQLYNVLIGDMSLVGPRPLPLRDYKGFDEDWHRRRFSVRPGITCLWQVNGRSNTSFHKWMELDMYYIDHWSLALDLRILAETIPAVLRGNGAA